MTDGGETFRPCERPLPVGRLCLGARGFFSPGFLNTATSLFVVRLELGGSGAGCRGGSQLAKRKVDLPQRQVILGVAYISYRLYELLLGPPVQLFLPFGVFLRLRLSLQLQPTAVQTGRPVLREAIFARGSPR